MSERWERTYAIGVPVERVWEVFTSREELAVLMTPPAGAETQHAPSTLRVLEAEPLKKLRWMQERPGAPGKTEFTVVFESTESGSSITVTRCGFGEGEDADIFLVSFGLGWEHGLKDLIMYLETGQMVKRHYDGCSLSCMGMAYVETDSGIEVRQVGREGLAAEAGLERGDRLVRVGGTAVYTRSDIWALNGVHPVATELEIEFIRGRELHRACGRTAPLTSRLVGE